MNNNYINRVPSPYLSSNLVMVRTITPVHAGVGRAGGVIDLPIQRDEYGYPSIYSSSLKGAFKTALLQAFLKELNNYSKARRSVQALLGPEPEERESFESSVAFLDAYLFAMPVRSLKGVYVYVTSPLLLKRFYERFELLTKIFREGKEQEERDKAREIDSILKALREIAEKDLQPSEAVCIDENMCKKFKESALGGKIVLAEEFLLDIVKDINEDHVKRLNNFSRRVIGLDKSLLVVSDENELAKNIIERSVLRFTRVKLSRETKTVSAGPWTEEYLPPKTVLHTMALFKKPSLSNNFVKKILGNHNKEKKHQDEEDYLNALEKLGILGREQVAAINNSASIIEKMQLITKSVENKFKQIIKDSLKGYIILGGHETIGKGIVSLRLLSLEDLEKTIESGG